MSSRFVGAWVNQLELLFKRGAIASLGEGQLLERFVVGQDESAFAALVARHGPMVLGVCRRHLHDEHEVEDAFQATFLVLVRRAGGIRNGDLIGHWLHGVAHRVAVRARANSARRHVHEQTGLDVWQGAAKAASADPSDRETRGVLDEELSRLPESLRAPMVLCYLEGLTHDEAAQRLQWPVGTVRSRMARARNVLRQRLERRGLAAQWVLPTVSLPGEFVSPALFHTTLEVCCSLAAKNTASAAVLASAAGTLAHRVIQAMLISKLKVAGFILLACAISLGGYQTFGPSPAIGADGNAEEGGADSPKGNSQDTVLKTNSDLQKEIKELRSELQALRRELRGEAKTQEGPAVGTAKGQGVAKGAAGSTAPRNAAGNRSSMKGPAASGMMSMGSRAGGPGMFMANQGMMSRMGGMSGMQPQGMMEGYGAAGNANQFVANDDPNHLNYIATGSLIVVPSPEGDKVTAFSTASGLSKSFRLFDSKEPQRTVVPVINNSLAALKVSGPNITRIAAFSHLGEDWYVQELREPVEDAHPILNENSVVYCLGRYAYAFSTIAKRWAVLTLPEEATASATLQPQAILVAHGGHLYVFSVKTGEWVDIDTRSHSDNTEKAK